MDRLTLASLIVSIAALGVAFFMWLRVRALERSLHKTTKGGHGTAALGFADVELSLEAILEELESKGQEVLKKIDRRERELRDALMQTGARAREIAGALRAVPIEGRLHGQSTAAAPHVGTDGSNPASAGKWGEKADMIRRLAEEGLDVVAIAQRLGLGKGEVQLILDLRKPAQ